MAGKTEEQKESDWELVKSNLDFCRELFPDEVGRWLNEQRPHGDGLPAWRQEWPDRPGAWWFYGVMKREKNRALFILNVHATKNKPPVYIAAWQQEIMQPGEITGWFKFIPLPVLPDGSEVEVW